MIASKPEISEEHITLTVRTFELKRFLEWQGTPDFHGRRSDWTWSEASYSLNVPVHAISAERSPVVSVAARDEERTAPPNPDLTRLLSEAREAQALVEKRRDQSLHELARSRGKRPLYFSRLLRLNYLAPDIVTAILDGIQPDHITRRLLLEAELPLDWSIQRRLFGFPAQRDRHRITKRTAFQA